MTTKSKRHSADEKFVVRLPLGMRGKIALKAKENTRSMNSEMVHRLEQVEQYEEALARANSIIDQLLGRLPEQVPALMERH
ncbi:Arc family DNA-binding protein [Pseudomonas sp. 21LCFQ02]|uniref:Arc family DNA-binding protein n=1 Tax=Pseudomonas sp. 21LCFQ02 TaxID=2957505 RepID=UPI00209B2BB5|nr:Arc family DNA-binding protein [Pseudomonas sp. 21LCFQ02]MCO8171165.1 Arc family DNA-binding protein [Pseudomonas sp. 21LCFQ02]